MNYLKYNLPLFIVFAMACSSVKTRTPKIPKREVPISINIKAENNSSVNFINLDYFRLQLIQELDQFQAVDFVLVEPSESPEVVMNINLTSFTLWPRDERRDRRRVSRNIAVGTDNLGKPIYQTVSASVDIIEIQRRSNARFATNISIKGTPDFKFQRTFMSSYNYMDAFVDNVQGDMRALDPRLMMRGTNVEPVENDFLLILARQEMIRRLSSELRNYYDLRVKAPN